MTKDEFVEKMENIFADFLKKWRKKGIELKIEVHDTQSIVLLAKPFYTNDHYEAVLTQNAKGVALEPWFLADVVGWEITGARTIDNDSFIQFLDIIKEFVITACGIPLEEGKNTETTPAFFSTIENRKKGIIR